MLKKELWAQVTDTPLLSRRKVFKTGMENGSTFMTPIGGHVLPTSLIGDMALWKKPQNQAEKNRTSDKIKMSMATLSPSFT